MHRNGTAGASSSAVQAVARTERPRPKITAAGAERFRRTAPPGYLAARMGSLRG
jgi:hypothetical protein